MDDDDEAVRLEATRWWGVIVGGVLAVDLTLPRRARDRLAVRRLIAAAIDVLDWPAGDYDDTDCWALATAVIDATAVGQAWGGDIEHHRRTGDLEGARDCIWERLEAEWSIDTFTTKGPELIGLLLELIAGHGQPDSPYPDMPLWPGVGDIELGNLELHTLR